MSRRVVAMLSAAFVLGGAWGVLQWKLMWAARALTNHEQRITALENK